PFCESLYMFSTADSASTPASARWCGCTRASGPGSRRRAAAGTASPAPLAGAGAAAAGGVAVCGRNLIGRAPGRSSGERLQQPVEVPLVVPRPDGRSQPGAVGNVTHDHPVLLQQLPLA